MELQLHVQLAQSRGVRLALRAARRDRASRADRLVSLLIPWTGAPGRGTAATLRAGRFFVTSAAWTRIDSSDPYVSYELPRGLLADARDARARCPSCRPPWRGSRSRSPAGHRGGHAPFSTPTHCSSTLGRAAAARIEQPDARTHELVEVLVAGYDHDVRALINGPARASVPITSSASYPSSVRIGIAAGLEDRADPLHPAIEVGLQLIGQLLPRRLVRGVALVAERHSGVVHPAEVVGPVRRAKTLEEVDHAPCGGRVLSTARRQWSRNERVERAIDQRVPVDQEDARGRRGSEGVGGEAWPGDRGHGQKNTSARPTTRHHVP